MTDDDTQTNSAPADSPDEDDRPVPTDGDNGDDVPFEWTQNNPPDTDNDTPFGELAAGVKQRREAAGDDDDPFEEMDVGDVDADEVWETLEDEPSKGLVDEEPIGQSGRPDIDRSEHVVDKRQYCQRCPYLSAPPDVTCGHEGTEIVEVVDNDQFLVRACPMVAEGGPRIGSDS